MWVHPEKTPASVGKKDVPLTFPIDGGDPCSAGVALLALFRGDPVPEGRWSSTPLFRDTRGQPCTMAGLMAVLKSAVAQCGGHTACIGTHCLRIGGGTALAEAGVEPIVIQTVGRWSTDIYRIYVRRCKGSMVRAMRAMTRVLVRPAKVGPMFR